MEGYSLAVSNNSINQFYILLFYILYIHFITDN